MKLPFDLFPDDEYNRRLLSEVHPPDWVNPEPSGRYNLVVIGGGTAGLVAAAACAGLGGKAALIERHLMGGDCLNVGCVPSKALIQSSRLRAGFARAGEWGWKAGEPQADFPAVMRRLRRIRASLSPHDSARRFKELGVDVFIGEGRFTGPETVEVSGKRLRFKKALIATGARAARPVIPGLEETGFLTNETVFNLTEQPKRLAVIGGGPLGCELSQAFRRFGSEVTIFHRGPRLLHREDPDAAALLSRVFEREGIKTVLEVELERVGKTSSGKVLHYRSKGIPGTAHVDEILVGAGRIPNVEGLGLEEAGVQCVPEQGVKVDDFLRTTHPHIFAAGDVCGGPQFTHVADAAARIVVQNALFRGRARFSSLVIPRCTYTDPEIAHVGLDEREAGEKGLEMDSFVQTLSGVDRAVVEGETEGFLKIHVKKGTDRILGATLVASHAGEMISEITTAMVNRVGLGRMTSVIHPYPTQAEAIKKIADAYRRTKLTPALKRLFGAWLSWGR